eukprot:CAMPEP_0173467702 /NCGR_PEP_ID=MMETSP1357-20121228/75541_1 /TAXON_ID=77926 /ORGANISM="Hemiselmis rufescens, Strain PCC563" /LENGTH=61 /DNA_ID=CAMNT_0014435857 /DNA_START=33 /DNA_END=215 /DNA_ORIENTATION=+
MEAVHEQAMELFAQIDQDGSGEVDAAELRGALANWGVKVSEREAVEMIAEVTNYTEEQVVN